MPPLPRTTSAPSTSAAEPRAPSSTCPRSPSSSVNHPATTEIYTLSLHDALPISRHHHGRCRVSDLQNRPHQPCSGPLRSEEHTSELQSRQYLVCRLLLEKKNWHGRLERVGAGESAGRSRRWKECVVECGVRQDTR